MPYVDTGRVSLFFKEAGSSGIPVLLLHELGGSSESWREVIPRLASDRRVVAEEVVGAPAGAAQRLRDPGIVSTIQDRRRTAQREPLAFDRHGRARCRAARNAAGLDDADRRVGAEELIGAEALAADVALGPVGAGSILDGDRAGNRERLTFLGNGRGLGKSGGRSERGKRNDKEAFDDRISRR